MGGGCEDDRVGGGCEDDRVGGGCEDDTVGGGFTLYSRMRGWVEGVRMT